MSVLEKLIENHRGTAAHKQEEAYDSDVPAGAFIEELKIYKDIAYPDPDNVEPIEEEALMTDIKGFESSGAYDQYILA